MDIKDQTKNYWVCYCGTLHKKNKHHCKNCASHEFEKTPTIGHLYLHFNNDKYATYDKNCKKYELEKQDLVALAEYLIDNNLPLDFDNYTIVYEDDFWEIGYNKALNFIKNYFAQLTDMPKHIKNYLSLDNDFYEDFAEQYWKKFSPNYKIIHCSYDSLKNDLYLVKKTKEI